MDEARALVVSDAHLGGVPAAVDAAFHAFLDEVPQAGDHLVVNGDLFEFWFEYRSVIPRRAFPTLARLAAVRRRGVKLTVTGGNHDRWGCGFWQNELGAAFHPGQVVLDLAGWRSLVAHGDGLTESHMGARMLQAITRHPLTAGLFRWVHPDLGQGLVERFSGILGSRTRDPRVIARTAAAQADWARSLLVTRTDLDLVVLGHTHRATVVAVGARRWYLNPGAWMDGFRYAVITARGPELAAYLPK
jgi:UDP-2,3-diacylglucosamine hydrolase